MKDKFSSFYNTKISLFTLLLTGAMTHSSYALANSHQDGPKGPFVLSQPAFEHNIAYANAANLKFEILKNTTSQPLTFSIEKLPKGMSLNHALTHCLNTVPAYGTCRLALTYLAPAASGDVTEHLAVKVNHQATEDLPIHFKLIAKPHLPASFKTPKDSGWQPVHLNGGQFVDIKISLNNPNQIYAVAYGAGIYESNDNGKTWQSISQTLPITSVSEIALTPHAILATSTQDANNLFPLVYKSTDNGSHWTQVTGLAPYSVTSHFVQLGSTLYAVNTNINNVSQIYASNDEGSTWKAVSSPLNTTDVVSLIVTTVKGQTVFLIGDTNNGVYRSADNGQTWQVVPNLNNTVVSLFKMDDGTLLADTYSDSNNNQLFKSTDGGQTWPNLPSFGRGLYAPATNFSQAGNLLYASSMKGVFLSADGGSTWTLINNIPDISPDIGVNWVAAANHSVFAGTSLGLYQTQNQGQSWTETDDGINGQWIASMASGPQGLFAVNIEGAVYRSTDNGQTWQPQMNGLVPTKLGFSQEQLVQNTQGAVYGQFNNTIQSYGTSPQQWQNVSLPTSFAIATTNSIALGEKMLVASFGLQNNGSDLNTQLAWTNNNGKTWQTLGPVFSNFDIYDEVLDETNQLVYTFGNVNDPVIMKTSLSGNANWTPLALLPNKELPLQMQLDLSGNVYVSGLNDQASISDIFVTSNQGQSWQTLTPPSYNNVGFLSNLMVNGSNITVASSQPARVFNSPDGGKSWNTYGQALMNGIDVLSLGHDQAGNIYMGTNNGFYVYPNGLKH